MITKGDVLLYSASEMGHRASYITLFSTIFSARRAKSLVEAVLSSKPILFLMVEESFGAYAITAVLRALIGRRTAGLLFRPGPAIAPTNTRLRLKSSILRLLKAMPRVTTITILPFDVDPRMAEIADDWIHDPQLWDLTETEKGDVRRWRAERTDGPGLAGENRRAAGQRLVVTAIGRQDRDKGFDLFVKLYAASAVLRKRTLFAYGGKVDLKLDNDAETFEQAGGAAARRFISDTEMLELYACADLIWATYAQGYDQASGIFGRAVQLGLTPIIREGSLIHRQCVIEDLPHLAITDETALDRILAYQPKIADPIPSPAAQWRANAVVRLRRALGVSL